MKLAMIRGIHAAIVVSLTGLPAALAVDRHFDNSCGDMLWHACCGPEAGTKSNNWDVASPPAPLCPVLPSGDDDVFIDQDCTVQAAMTGVAKNITQMNGTFTVNGGLQVAEIGTFAGPMIWNSGEIGRSGGALAQQIILNGGLTMQSDTAKTLSFFGGFRLTNNGAATWSGAGDWTIGMIPGACCPAIFENSATGTFDIQNAAKVLFTAFGPGVFENAGTLTKSSAGVSDWAVNLNNTGLVHIQNGELRLSQSGAIGGNWLIEPGAELGITGAFFTLVPGVVIQGRAVVKDSPNFGIVVDQDVTIEDLTVAATGRLGGSATLGITGTLTDEGGQPNVHLHILPGGHIQENGIGNFFGQIDLEGTINIASGAAMGCFNQFLNIMPGAVLTIEDGGELHQTGLVDKPVENHGTLRKPPTAGTATIANAFNVELNNHSDGVVSVEGGTFRCRNNLDSAGTIDIAAGAEFSMEGWASYHPGTNITGEGFFHLNHAANNFVDAGYELVVPRLRVSGNMNAGHGIGGNGDLAVTHEFDLQGGRIFNPLVTIREAATMNVTGPDDVGPAFTGGHITFENLGTTNVIAQNFHFAVFNNRPTGVVDLKGDFEFSRWFGGGPVANEGLLTKTGGSGESILWAMITNTGTIRAVSGRMLVQNPITQNSGLTELAGGTLTAFSLTLNGGELRGVGDISSNVNNVAGTVEPGASPGILNITPDPNYVNVPIVGNYTQGAGGRLVVEVGGLTPGTQHDQLVVAATANLNGTLELKQFGGFFPADGDQITVLTANAITGVVPSVVTSGFPGCVSATAQIVGNALVATFSIVGGDTDSDGTPDCTDGCPNDPNKVAPGACGCGVADTDSDSDGVFDCVDVCPSNDPGLVVDSEGRPVDDTNGDCSVSVREAGPQPAPPVTGTPIKPCGFSILNSMAISFAMLVGARSVRPRLRRRRR